MKNARLVSGGRSQSLGIGNNNNENTLPSSGTPAQYPILPADGVHVGAIWKSARDRSQCIQASIRRYEGHPYLDLRVHVLDGAGRMVPSARGITCSLAQLGKLTQLVGNAYRMASTMRSS